MSKTQQIKCFKYEINCSSSVCNKTTGNGDKRKRTLSVHTNEAGVCFACELHDMFSGFNRSVVLTERAKHPG